MNLLRFNRPKPRRAGSQMEVIERIDDDLRTMITRGRFMGEKLEFGPNFVHAYLMRGPSGMFGPPGEVLDLGWSHNLKTTVGMDWLHQTMGGTPGKDGAATTVTATAVTPSGGGMTTDQYKGMRVVMAVTGITTAPVYGNIGSNSATVLTIDGWWVGTADTMTGTTPANTNGYIIVPAMGPARFIGLTTDTSGPAVGDTVLTSETTASGLTRAKATFAHTGGATTFTQSNTFAAGATLANIHKAGLFTAANTTAAGIDVANTNLNADASVTSGDSLAVTWTWTLPAAG
jgi:hypothetical protein